jgi:ketosteroid isomerase-like protein
MNRRNSIITGLTAISAVATFSTTAKAAENAPAESKSSNPDLEKIRALLKQHDDAMTSHNLEGVLAVLAPKAVLMGSGPGEIWSTPEEMKEAYTNFFSDFDKGEQHFTYHVKFGGLSSEMGWLIASGEIQSKKDGKSIDFPLNISLTVTKIGESWKIAAMHFSTLTGEKAPK